MTNSVRMNVQGLAELERSLDNLSKSMGKSVLRRALRKAAVPMKDLAVSLAPEDTGGLKKSIIIGSTLNKRQRSKHRKMTAEERSAVELFVGPSYVRGARGRHGHLVEFGTAPHVNGGKFAGTEHPGTAPQPFMRPAFDQEARPTIERLKPILMAEIDATVKRQAKKAGWDV